MLTIIKCIPDQQRWWIQITGKTWITEYNYLIQCVFNELSVLVVYKVCTL